MQEYIRRHANSPDSDDAGNLHEEPLDQTIRGPPVTEAPEFTQFLDDLRTASRAQTPALQHTPLPPAPPVITTAPSTDPLAMSGVQGTDPPAPSDSGTRELTTDEQIYQMVTAVKSLAATVQTLSQSVATLTGATGSITGHARPINIVEKPKAFEGKTSEGARLFRSSFTVWVQDHESAFQAT